MVERLRNAEEPHRRDEGHWRLRPRSYSSRGPRRDVGVPALRRSRQWPSQERQRHVVHRKGRNDPNSRRGRSQRRRCDRLSEPAPQAGQTMVYASSRRSTRDI
jgi:hypothetical protein